MRKIIYILDAYAFIYRSYYAFNERALINKEGMNVSSIFGFFKSLYVLLKIYNPNYFVVALDSRVPTFRHKMYPEYKANRKKTPEDLHKQIPFIINILEQIGFSTCYHDEYEADDIIASVIARCEKEGYEARIISGDKDLLQLINDNIKVIKQDAKGKWIIYEKADVEKDWGVPPSLMLDLLSITGDVSDNVPGIKGIGIKGAQKLLLEYKSLEGIYQNIEKIKGAQKQKLIDGKHDAFFSKKLINLNNTINIETLDVYSIKHIELSKAIPIFEKLQMPSLSKLYSETIFNLGLSNQNEQYTIEKQEKLPKIKHFSIEEIKTVDGLENFLKMIAKKTEVTLSIYKKDDYNTLCFIFNLGEEKQYYFALSFDGKDLDALLINDKLKAINDVFLSNTLFIVYDGKSIYHKIKDLTPKLEFPSHIFDVMIAAYLIEPDRKEYDLLSLSKTFIEDFPNKKDNLSFNEKSNITEILYSVFLSKLKNNNLLSLFNTIEMPLLVLLGDMERKGIKIDKNILLSFSFELKEKLKKLEEKAIIEAGHEFNIASYKQLQKLLFEERGLKPIKKNKQGFSTSSEVLERLVNYDPLPAIILEHRMLSKLESTYTHSLIEEADEKDRIHTHFIQTGAATGRLSSQTPNLQNIPVHNALGLRIREAFCAEDEKLLISSDYSQIELVVLAHISGDKVLKNIITEGIDVHKRTASVIFNVDEHLITQEMRAMAKAVNFGVIYGMSAYGLSEELHISRSAASSFICSYFSNYKGVKDFIEKIYIECEEKGYVETIMGHRRYVNEIKSNHKKTKELGRRIAVNTIIQGSAADIMKKAMLDVWNALKVSHLNASILLQVHDELIIESVEKDADEVMNIVKKTMENAYPLSIPLRVSISKGKTWASL